MKWINYLFLGVLVIGYLVCGWIVFRNAMWSQGLPAQPLEFLFNVLRDLLLVTLMAYAFYLIFKKP
jgi:hypothetical protein